MQANSWYYKLFHYRLSFWIGKVLKKGKKGKKLQNVEYLGNDKSFSDEIKSIFHSFFFLKKALTSQNSHVWKLIFLNWLWKRQVSCNRSGIKAATYLKIDFFDIYLS